MAGEGGTVSPAPGTYPFPWGTKVTLKAVPKSGFRFAGWSGALSGKTNPVQVIMYADKTVTASFKPIIRNPDNFHGEKLTGGRSPSALPATLLTWNTPWDSHIQNIAGYRIYLLEGQTRILLAELTAEKQSYLVRNADHSRPQAFGLTLLDKEGRESGLVEVTVR
jgi:uncharacterized repeat protein (TIGR02543 family)